MENKNLLDENELSEVSGGIVDITKIDPSFLTDVDEKKMRAYCIIKKGKGWTFDKVYSHAVEEVLPGIQNYHANYGIFPVSDEYFRFRLEQIWLEVAGK